MVGALLVLLGVVGAFVVFRDLNRNDPANPVRPVDWESPARYARAQADYPLLAPERLPDGWMATSVRFEGGEWSLGMLTEDEQYVGLKQADRPVASLVEQHVDPEAVQGEDVAVAGETWQTWTDDAGDLALVREDAAVTTMVVGTAPLDTLVEFTASLR
jgi:hypothetical protein